MKPSIYWFLMFCAVNTLSAQELHYKNKDLPCIDKHFNIHVQIVLDSFGNLGITTEQLQNAVDQANRYFEPICFSFSMCEIDTIHNYAYDKINLQNELSAFFTNHLHPNRLNMLVVDSLVVDGFGDACGIGGGNLVVLDKACTGLTLTHELGHVFGLPHTFSGNGEENADGSNCETAGDGICDTPADPYDYNDKITVWERNCEFVYEGLDANSQYYQPDMGNIMSYYSCRCGFTRGQYLRMVESYLNSGLTRW